MTKAIRNILVLLLASELLGVGWGLSAHAKPAANMDMSMGPMDMSGAVTMNGKKYDMTCSMKPIGKPKSMSMGMNAPLNMKGTMTMMGQEYTCSMKMIPLGKLGQSNRMSVQDIKKDFRGADKNHDGHISLDEMIIHEGGNKDRGQLHFNDADRNKDGKVDEAEWIRHHQESPLHNSKDDMM